MREDRTPKTVLTGNKIKMPKIKMGTNKEQHGKKWNNRDGWRGSAAS
jgi:hypothetical protein